MENGLYETFAEALASQAENGGLVVKNEVGTEEGYTLFSIDNLKDIFSEVEDEVLEYVFAHAEHGVDFDMLKSMVEVEMEEQKEWGE